MHQAAQTVLPVRPVRESLEPGVWTTPPPPVLAFRVGIVGHRPNRLLHADPSRLAATIGSVLSTVHDTVESCHGEASPHYAPDPPVLRAISPLAEGTDRIFAQEALARDYALCCPMPFPKEEYERDFTDLRCCGEGSIREFRAILEKARSGAGLVTFELDGRREEAGAAYGAAGRVVLIQSDLLIVVWDGGEAQGSGGTVETMYEALRSHLPVVWIDAWSPHSWRLLRSTHEIPSLRTAVRATPDASGAPKGPELAEVVRGMIEWPPERGQHADPKRLWEQTRLHLRYLRAHKPGWNLAFIWKFFRDLIGSGKLTIQPLRVPPIEETVRESWPTEPPDKIPAIARWVNLRLRAHFAWPDRLADLHADAYRSAFVYAYLAAAMAVFLVLVPGAAGWPREGDPRPAIFYLGEFVLVLGIVLAFIWARVRRWHAGWIDYRTLAEMIRQMRFQIPLGGARSRTRQPAYLGAYGDPSMTWMFWHKLAVERACGLPTARVDHNHLDQCLGYFESLVREQAAFHHRTLERYERIRKTLDVTVLALVGAILICILIHLRPVLLHARPLPGRWEGWLTVACAVMPALGAALAAINEQGEFARVSKRCRAMHDRLAHVLHEIKELREAADPERNPLRLSQVAGLVAPTAQLMADEVLDWRVIFRDRPIMIHP